MVPLKRRRAFWETTAMPEACKTITRTTPHRPHPLPTQKNCILMIPIQATITRNHRGVRNILYLLWKKRAHMPCLCFIQPIEQVVAVLWIHSPELYSSLVQRRTMVKSLGDPGWLILGAKRGATAPMEVLTRISMTSMSASTVQEALLPSIWCETKCSRFWGKFSWLSCS